MATRQRITASLANAEYQTLNRRQRTAYRRAVGAGQPATRAEGAARHAAGMRAAGRKSAGSAGG